MRNEKGFILPSVSMIAFFILLILLHQTAVFTAEKKFYSERERSMILENLLLCGVQHSMQSIADQEGVNHYEIKTDDGSITYTAAEKGEGELLVSLAAKLNTGHFSSARYTYNLNSGEMTDWTVY